MSDLYKVLELDKSASNGQIKKAYHRLAMIWHPDKNSSPEAKAKFQEITKAYEILGDEEKRRNYDTYGTMDESGGGGIDPREIFSRVFGGMGGMGMGGFPFGNIFEVPEFIRGGNNGGKVARKNGPDTIRKHMIGINEMMNGDTKTVNHERHICCIDCNGSGGKSGNYQCSSCRGNGRMQVQHQMGPNMFSTQIMPCNKCGGSGTFIPESEKCKRCHGSKINKKMEKIKIEIPRGARNGDAFIVSGLADFEPNTMNSESQLGDLVFKFVEETDEKCKWRRVENDLWIQYDVLLSEALCGIDRKINHLDGSSYRLIHNQVITPGSKYKIDGLGFPKQDGGRGDLVLIFSVVFPKEIKDNRKEFIMKLLPTVKELTIEEKEGLSNIYMESFSEETSEYRRDYDEEEVDDGKECVIC